MSFEESFLYPLGLLAIGSVITMFLVPRFSDRFNKKRHELEIKRDLIVRITEYRQEWHLHVGTLEFGADETEYENPPKLFSSLNTKGSVIHSLLVLYFSDERVFSNWDKFHNSLRYSYHYLANGDEKDLVKLSEVLGTEILSKKDRDLEKSIDKGIRNLFGKLLRAIEESELKKH